MKKLAILSAIALGGLIYNSAYAQVRVHVGLNLGAPAPMVVERAPAVYNDYYYLPDVGAYYSVYEHRYYYPNGGTWVSAAWLPGYRNYDWHSFRRYEIRGARPYMHDEIYRARYNGHGREWARAPRYDDGFRGHDRHFENRGWAHSDRDDHFDRGRHEGHDDHGERGHGEGDHHR